MNQTQVDNKISIPSAFSTGVTKEFLVNREDNVSTLRTMILSDPTLNITTEKIMLIYHGKVLSDNTKIVEIDPDLDYFCINCFVLQKQGNAFNPKNKEEQTNSRIEDSTSIPDGIVDIFWNSDNNGESSSDDNSDSEWLPSIFTDELPLDHFFDSDEFENNNHNGDQTLRRNSRKQVLMFFFIGIFIGYCFGIGALLFAILTFRKKILMCGILIGSCIHYFSYIFNYY